MLRSFVRFRKISHEPNASGTWGPLPKEGKSACHSCVTTFFSPGLVFSRPLDSRLKRKRRTDHYLNYAYCITESRDVRAARNYDRDGKFAQRYWNFKLKGQQHRDYYWGGF